jgi:transposase
MPNHIHGIIIISDDYKTGQCPDTIKRPLRQYLYYTGVSNTKKGAAMSKSFIGVDLHKKFCVFTELDFDGNVLRRGRFGNNNEEVPHFASSLSPKTKLAVEPLLNYLWFLDQVIPYVESVHPVNPHRVRIIAEAKNKTDKYDSKVLADLLRTNFLPESYYIPKDIRRIRDSIRQRSCLVRSRTRYKNRVRHLLFLNGSVIKATDVSSKSALKEINRLCLSEHIKNSINQCLLMIKTLNEQTEILTDEITSSCKDIEDIELLMTIPGIGHLLAITIYAEVVDIKRFKSHKAFASYTGLVPTVRASADKVHTGEITRVGSKFLRYALIEAAMRAPRKSSALSSLFHRVLYRSNSQKARVAVAHKLAIIIFAMLKNREAFRIDR